MKERGDWWLAFRHHDMVVIIWLMMLTTIWSAWDHVHWLQQCGFVLSLIMMTALHAVILENRVSTIRNQRELDALRAKQEGLRSLARTIGVNYDSITVSEVSDADS